MSRLYIATKRGYVRKLRNILTHDNVCNRCPAGSDDIVGNYLGGSHSSVCEWCRDFIDLRLIPSDDGKCPCDILKGNAIRRAHKALAKWNAGTHPWQQEGVEDESKRGVKLIR